MSRLAHTTAAYAFCHFVVDLACITTMMGSVSASLADLGTQQVALCILVYDLLAFCLQLPLGALLDGLGRGLSQRAGMASLALVAAGVSSGWCGGAPASYAAVPLVALGNALFHCVGGVEVLGESDGKAGPAGMFISTGAAGVFVGGLSAFNGWPGTPLVLLMLLVACAAVLLLAPRSQDGSGLRCELSAQGWIAVALLAATVALRSYTGMVLAFPWKADVALATCMTAAVMAGKACGGRVADRLGPSVTSLISLGGAAVLFLPAWESVPAGLSATFLFNFTMAITLCGLATLLPQAKGMAFGIASFSLAIGAVPALLGLRTSSGVALCLLSLASLVLLELGLAVLRRGGNHG